MNPLLRALGLSFSLLLAVPTFASELKVGFINTTRIFQEINLAKNAQNRLRQEFSKRENQLLDLTNQLKTTTDQFNRDQATLSESQQMSRQRDIAELDRELQRKRRAFQEDLNARRNEELESVRNKANLVIKQLANDEKFDLILQDAVWVSPRLDITDKVIKAINTNAK